jgi:ankyrin repeat protein/N-acetylneuraminic acid mutarotase
MKTTISSSHWESFSFTALLCAALCLLAWPARAGTNDLTSAIQRGLFEEEANQNLGAAIQAYQAVASQFDKDRKLAATAIFRLGECYRKQGNTNDAATQYERILREFSDQPTLVTLSRQSLAGMGGASPAPAAPVLSNAARQEQKRSLEEEMKLVQKQLETQQAQVKAGVVAPDALLANQRDLLKLKRQLTALDAGLPFSIAATETPAPPTSTEAEEVKRIRAMIKDSPDLINAKSAATGFAGKTPLHTAAGQGQLIVAQFLLENGADVGAKDNMRRTSLYDAAGAGHKSMVELLLDHQASVQAVDNDGLTPLHLAAQHGYRSVVESLLAHAADVNAKDKYGSTPLVLASAYGFKSVADLLLAHGADINAATMSIYTGNQNLMGTPLCIAARRGDQPLVELLLSKGAQVNAEDKEGHTPLSWAATERGAPVVKLLLEAHAAPNAGRVNLPLATTAYQGDLPSLKLLLANGANPNTDTTVSWGVRTKVGNNNYSQRTAFTPLFLGVNQQQADAVGELLHAKADPNTTDPEGYPLLFEALPHAPTLKALLEGGADPNRLSPQGASPLLQAVLATNQLAVELLLAHQADPNAGRSQEGGYTPLHAAAVMGAKPIAELLVRAGAAVNAKNNGGATPLHEAVWRGRFEVSAMLLANQADPNAKNNDGETPLHYAVRSGQRESAELLLANQADPNERNNAGQTPLDQAKSQPLSAPGQTLRAAGGYPGLPPAGQPSQPLSYQWRPGTPASASAPESKPGTMADLLRQHGAVDDLPHLDQIGTRRGTIGFSEALFTKGAQDWNQFTLLELVAVQYKLLAASPSSGGGDGYMASALFSNSRLPFPDLAHLHISRPTSNLKGWQDQAVDLRPVLESGDCAKDARLSWGDVVEIPEADHPLNEGWGGFSAAQLSNFKKCLTRQVEIVIKGQATRLTLAPQISGLPEKQEATNAPPSVASTFEERLKAISARNAPGPLIRLTPFWLKPVLLQSKLVLTSSDLRHVKVTRHDAAGGQDHEWVVDCSTASPAPDFWLRDGDKIEVPEKSASAMAEEEPRAPTLAPPGQAYSQRLQNIVRRTPASSSATDTPPAVKEPHYTQRLQAIINRAAIYSPMPDDPELLQSGYQRDRTAKPRKGESWEERAGAELNGRAGNTAVWTGADLVVFGGEGMGTSYGDGARYCLAEDTWATLPQKGGPSSRTGHAAVWTGKEMIIWGGFGGYLGKDTNRNDGARYNPATDTWKPVTTRNAPAARFDFPAVWTGREMLVWGGYTDSHSRYQGAHADAHLNTGGRYDPSADSWKTITSQGAPSKRFAHTMIWTGKQMIVWGGGNTTKALNDGGRYNPARDFWRPVSTDGAPSPRLSHVAVWTGKEMLVWGGTTRETDAQSVYFENGARYNPEADTWRPISTIGAPKGRVSATAVWTGTEMLVWGGVNDAQVANGGDFNRFVGTGARYNPATDTWTELTLTGAPSPRLTTGVWTGEGLLTFGGYNGTHLNDCWFYSLSRTLYPYVKE